MRKISIIVPVYQAEKYISKCIESIINQTYTNLEIILINDGSTDRSGEICDEYRDARIYIQATYELAALQSVSHSLLRL